MKTRVLTKLTSLDSKTLEVACPAFIALILTFPIVFSHGSLLRDGERFPDRHSGSVKNLFWIFAIFVFTAKLALGWAEPPPPPDCELVQMSDCIVVGHAKDASLEHPVLVITETLKGIPPAKEIPIIIPSPGTFMSLENNENPGFAKGLTIWELGSMAHPICDDIRQDQIWFLRTDPKAGAPMNGNNPLRIFEPADIKPLKVKAYYLALLSKDPDIALENFTLESSGFGAEARGSLMYLSDKRQGKVPNSDKWLQEFLALKKITANENANARLDELVQFYLNSNNPTGQWMNLREQALDGVEASGSVGAKKLQTVFFDANPAYKKICIMEFWRRIDYQDAVPTLLELLQKEDRFWSSENMQDKSWWPPSSYSNSTMKIDSYHTVLFALGTLQTLKVGVKAKSTIESTKKRWENVDPSGEIIRRCDQLLSQMAP